MNKFIAGALILLVILIATVLLLTNLLNKSRSISPQDNLTPIPTTGVNTRTPVRNTTDFSPHKAEEEVAVMNKSLTQDQINTLADFQKKLPISNPDFDIGYSDLTGTYFIQRKTSEADQKIQDFLNQNNLGPIEKDFPSFFIKGDEDINTQIQKAEDPIKKAREDGLKKTLEEPVAPAQTDQMQPLADLFDKMMNLNFQSVGGVGEIANPNELDKIFNEAGTKVGTPPKFLKAMMAIECGRLITATPAQDILAWSAPGAPGLPPSHFCYRNSKGAKGPMQFMDNTWPGYRATVNQIGGYTHASSVENIRDAVYGAAAKFKSDAQASGPNWTEAQIRRAYGCYASGCGGYAKNPGASQSLYNRFVPLYNSF